MSASRGGQRKRTCAMVPEAIGFESNALKSVFRGALSSLSITFLTCLHATREDSCVGWKCTRRG